MRAFLSYLISLSIFAGSLPVFGQSLRCESLLSPRLYNLIIEINQVHDQYLTEHLPLEELVQTKSWLQKRKIRNLLQKQNLGQLPSQESVERLATELSLALFGNRNQVDRFLKIEKQERLKDSALHMVKEGLIRQGILKYWQNNFEADQVSRLSLILDSYQNLKEYRLFQALSIPSRLPKMKDQSLPPDLIVKIVKNGYDQNALEVQRHLNNQNKIEAYNTFRRLYSPIFFGVILAFTTYIGMNQLNQLHQNQVDDLIENLQKSRQMISTGVEDLQKQEFEFALELAREEFVAKWGEPPTAEEYDLLKRRIANALKIKNH